MNKYSKNKIHIFGDGDLSKEFASFANFDDNNVVYYSKDDELNLDIKSLINKVNKVYIAISNSEARSALYNNFIKQGLIPDTYIHPSVIIGKRTSIGFGCIIEPNVIISNDVVIQNSVFINCNSNIGHDCEIGEYSSIMASVNVGGHCDISSKVYIGSGATILPKIKINPKIKIGAGSVVIKNLTELGSYFGNPAKKIF